jgi:hypothetical protein
MIYMWFTGINYYKLAVEKDRDSIFTTIWKPGSNVTYTKARLYSQSEHTFRKGVLT